MTSLKPRGAAAARRRRATLRVDADSYRALWCAALDPASPAWVPLGWAAGADAAARELALRALLVAFVDAARPAGGLAVDDAGQPVDLPGLLAQGRALALQGVAGPRLERNIREGRPIDLRLAQALRHFFALVLQQPRLQLDALGVQQAGDGAFAPQRRAQAQRVSQLLPEAVFDALRERASEVQGAAWALTRYHRSYRGLQLLRSATGGWQARVMRCTRYEPLKLVDFHRPFHATQTYELYEWDRHPRAWLVMRQLDDAGRPLRAWRLEMTRRIDAAQALMRLELPATLPPDPAVLMQQLAQARAGQHPRCEFEFHEDMLVRPADRDLVVSYLPIIGADIDADGASRAGFHLAVGDSPGLVSTGAGGWRLSRALLPREVLAVRWRPVGWSLAQAAAAAEAAGPPGAPVDAPASDGAVAAGTLRPR